MCRRAVAAAIDCARSASVAATLTAVGSARATSSAKLGPEITPTGAGHIGATTRCASATPGGSAAATKPFAQPDERRACVCARKACTIPVSAPTGVATTISEAPAVARDSSRSTSISVGMTMPGRYREFSREAAIERAAAESRAQRRSAGGAATRRPDARRAPSPRRRRRRSRRCRSSGRRQRRCYRPQTCAMRT